MRIKVLIFFIYVHVSTIDSSAECNFQCNDGQCIQDGWVCDDEEDCPSGEDEERGSCPDCNSQQFRCSTGRCIPLSYLCDNYYDCTTNEDESPQRCQGSGSSIPSKLEGKEWIVGPIMGVIGPLIIVVSIIIGLSYRSNQRARRIGSVKMQAFEVNSP